MDNDTQINDKSTSDLDVTSNDGLQIDIETEASSPKHQVLANQVLENLEEEIEKKLNEKASKTNLSVVNVKNILRQVLTNEYVLAMIKNSTGDSSQVNEQLVYQPKLTRAKTKELLKDQNAAIIPWVKPKPKSAVHILINEELPEDSDDDEYVPSEEEKESCHPSDVDSQPVTPATPASAHDSCTQTNWTEDGIFKIPQVTSPPPTITDTEIIALRTRSKLSLSDTPLEVFEEALIPPDITTDMYDLECDDEDWRDFLKQFTRPLAEAVPQTQEDDDEADPEYNILADEEVEKVDREELRQDKAVKISKKELQTLMAELLQFSEMFDNAEDVEKVPLNSTVVESTDITNQIENADITDADITNQIENADITDADVTNQIENADITVATSIGGKEIITEFIVSIGQSLVSAEQQLLLAQQVRQHVQLTTQNFLLTYQHPEVGDMAKLFKDMLILLKNEVNDNPISALNACNLKASIELVQNWEDLLETNETEAQKIKERFKRASKFRRKTAKATLFPLLLLKTISESDVFIYPTLLPTMMFRSSPKNRISFVDSENQLIALGLEQFIPYMTETMSYITKFHRVRLYDVSYFITRYMMPNKDVSKLYQHIKIMNEDKRSMNPIKYYFQHKKAPVLIHCVFSLEEFGILPPVKRQPDSLPNFWKTILFPEQKRSVFIIPQPFPLKKVQKPPAYNTKSCKKKTLTSLTKQLATVNANETIEPTDLSKVEVKSTDTSKANKQSRRKRKPKRRILNIPSPKDKVEKIPENNNLRNIPTSLLNLKFNSGIFKQIPDGQNETMLPSMPFLTPAKEEISKQPDVTNSEESTTSQQEVTKEKPEKSVFSEIFSKSKQDEEVTSVEVKKDDVNELNALMIASSTMQQKNRRIQNNSAKKAKLIRERNATLSMLCPENKEVVEEKAKKYAQAFYDKVQERLESESPLEYQKFMEALSEHDETSSSISDLYEKIESVLSPNNSDLCEEFLTFLTPEQAKQIGKLVPHFMMTNMSLFLRKLEIYYSKQPAQLRRIYKSLSELASSSDVTMEKIRNTILPLLKGNGLLIDWFLQMFPSQAPPESLMTDWEEVSYDEGDNMDDDEKGFETISLPEVEDPFGGPNCICDCHKIDNEVYASRTRHCIPCGTKFLQGRVYVQTGKGLRLANVTFNNGQNAERNKRLGIKSMDRRKRKADLSPSKLLMSPTKQDEEPRHSNESEDEINSEMTCKKLKTKSYRTSNSSKTRRKLTNKSTPKCLLKKVCKGKQKSETKKKQNAKQQTLINKVSKPTKTDQKPETETTKTETLETETTKPETPETETTKTETPETDGVESMEESSQDTLDAPVSESEDSTNEDAESVGSDNSEGSSSQQDEVTVENDNTHSWTRDEDKIILQTYQERGDSQNVFKDIQQLLPDRTVAEVRQRFQTLMSLLKKMASTVSE